MKVKCIDATNRPETIPLSKWIVKDKEYTVVQVDKINMEPGVFGFKLAELNIDNCIPYTYFRSTRFAVPKPIETLEVVEIEELELILKTNMAEKTELRVNQNYTVDGKLEFSVNEDGTFQFHVFNMGKFYLNPMDFMLQSTMVNTMKTIVQRLGNDEDPLQKLSYDFLSDEALEAIINKEVKAENYEKAAEIQKILDGRK